jgi:hypothetical protein
MQYKLGIRSQWYNNERTLILTEITESWDWEDVQANMANVLEMAQSVNYPLGLLVLLPGDLSIPPSGFSQASRQIASTHAEAELHTIVYVTSNSGLKTLWEETIAAVAQDPSRYFVASTIEEALILLDY